jgi:CheY-like chemotaxis protein
MAGKVLIAEDNNDFRELLGMLVTSLGYTAIEARNGIEAIEKAVSSRPDLILMDLRMPKLGNSAVSKLRSGSKLIP